MKYILTFENFADNYEDYSYEDLHLDYIDNQHIYRTNMFKDKQLLAYVDYSVYKDKVYINFIESIIKNKGYGSMLMEYLASKYGYENLERTSLTDDGIKMRQKLDKKFNFDYQKYKESISNHYDKSILDKIKNDTIKKFLKDMIVIGYTECWSKWIDYLRENNLLNIYDFNDISEISNWIKGSVTNNNDPEDEPPYYITDLLNSLF